MMRSDARRQIFGLPAVYWLVWCASFVGSAGRFVVPFLSSYLTASLGFSAAQAGAIVACYGFGGILAAVFGGFLSDRFGRIRIVVCSQVASAILLAFMPTASGELELGVLLFAFGTASNLASPALAALIADIVPPAQHARAYLLQVWGLNCGFVVGPLVAAGLAMVAFSLMFWVEAVVLVAIAAFLAVVVGRRVPGRAMAAVPMGHPADIPVAGIRAAYRSVVTDVTFLATIALVLVYTSVYFQSTTALPVAMHEAGFSTTFYGLLLSLNGVLLCVLQIPLIRVLERVPKTVTLAVAFLITAVGFALMAVAETWWQYAVAVVIWTIGELGTFPIATALAASLAPARFRGTYQSFYNLTWSGGNAVAPLAGGAVLSAAGGGVLWGACAILLMLSALVFLRMRSVIARREHQAAEAFAGSAAVGA